jgi:hypothetical protein
MLHQSLARQFRRSYRTLHSIPVNAQWAEANTLPHPNDIGLHRYYHYPVSMITGAHVHRMQ